MLIEKIAERLEKEAFEKSEKGNYTNSDFLKQLLYSHTWDFCLTPLDIVIEFEFCTRI